MQALVNGEEHLIAGTFDLYALLQMAIDLNVLENCARGFDWDQKVFSKVTLSDWNVADLVSDHVFEMTSLRIRLYEAQLKRTDLVSLTPRQP